MAGAVVNFELAIRAEFATQHMMHENGIELRAPLEMYIDLGYGLITGDPKKWEAIQKQYDFEIRKQLKSGIGDKGAFKYRPLKEKP